MNVNCSAEPCPVILDCPCVFYSGANLIYTGIVTNDNLCTALQKIDAKFKDAAIGYIFQNGVIQTSPGQPVRLGGSLTQNTTINSGAFTFTLTGTIESSAFITSGGISSQFVKGDGSLDSTSYQPAGNYITALTGDGTASGPGSAAFTLSNTGVIANTYGSNSKVPVITVDSKGRITNAVDVLINYPAQLILFSNDVLGSGYTGTTIPLTLATVNSNVYTSNTALKFAVNAKGLVTSAAPLDGTDINNALGYIPVPEAPFTGITYGRKNGAWVNVSSGGGSGTVTSVSVTAGTGISASVTNPTTTPNITITNTAPDQTVVLSSGTGISVTGTYPNFTITNTSPSSGGTVTGVTASSPLFSSGGTAPNITIQQASSSQNGYLSSADWTTFNSKTGGSGTLNYVPKWSSSTALTDSSIFDNGTSVGIGTATPDTAYKLHVVGAIATTSGVNIDPSISNKTGIYGATNQIQFWAGTNQLGTYRLNGALAGSYFEHTAGFANTGAYTGTQNVWRLAGDVTATVAPNSMNSTQLLINPTYNQGTFGTGTLRGVYYNPTLSNLNTSQHTAWENTSGDIIFGNLSGSGTRMVTADSTGKLSTATIPTGSGIFKGTASGTDTYTTTITGVTSYVDGDAYLIRFTNGNTTGCTLDINGLGARTLYRNNDGALIGGDIIAGAEMFCIYNSTLTGFQAIGTAPNTLLGYVTNADSVTITKGQVVYAFGGQGDRMTVKLASNTADATSARTVGVVLSTSIAANQKGLIMMQGLLDGLSILPTATWNDGDPVYLGATAGSITPTKPYAPNHLVYVATVTTASNGSSGRMYVNIQNGYELDELHNVQAQSPALKDTLWYDSTVSPGQWKTASIATILGYTPQAQLNGTGFVKASGTTISYDNTTYANLSQAAYTMLANNTNATANMTAQTFRFPSIQTYTGTIAWTGTAPSGATNHTYNWTRIGNVVTLNITLIYATAGTALTQVTMSLPTDCPNPVEQTGLGAANDVLYYGSGQLATAITNTTSAIFRSALRVNSGDTGYELFIVTTTSGGYRVAHITVQYFTS